MQIDMSQDGSVTTLKLSGEIDLHASPILREKLHECAKQKLPVVLVDFNGVDYIDSSGLATFIEYVRDAEAHDGKIALFGLKPKVRTIFEIVRLNELFTLSATADEALAALTRK